MVIGKVSFVQKQQLKLRFLLTQMFELIIAPESFLSFNCLLWKEVFFKDEPFSAMGFFWCNPSLLCPMALSPVGLCRSLEMEWWGQGSRWHSLASGPHLLARPQDKAGFGSFLCFSPETCPKHCTLNYVMQHLPGKSLWSNTDQKKEPGAPPLSHCSKVLVLCWLWNSSPLAEVAFVEVSLMERDIPPMIFALGRAVAEYAGEFRYTPSTEAGVDFNTTFSCGLKSFFFNKSVGKIKCYIFLSWRKIQLTSVSPNTELWTSFAVSLTGW